MVRLRSPRDVLAGVLFILFAGVIDWNAGKLDLGTAGRMGPGYFPMMLAGLLGLLGLIVLAGGLRYDGPPLQKAEWRGLALVTASIVVFSVALEPLGFLAAVFLSGLLSVLASRPVRPVGAALLIAGLMIFCAVVFVKLLGMPVRLWP
jgi:putative tricarboxylic transport membrane protein